MTNHMDTNISAAWANINTWCASDIFIQVLAHRFPIANETFEGHCGILCIIAFHYHGSLYCRSIILLRPGLPASVPHRGRQRLFYLTTLWTVKILVCDRSVKCEIWSVVEVILTRETEVLRENSFPVSRFLPQVLRGMAWGRTRNPVVRSRRLPTWPMARSLLWEEWRCR